MQGAQGVAGGSLRARTDEARAVVVRRGRVRGREGVAVELGVDAHGPDLINDRELANVHVHVGLDRQLPRRLEDGQARLHRACTTCPNQPPSVEDQHAAARTVEGKLDRRKPSGSVVCVRAPRGDGVQVQRQRDAAARHGHRLGQRDDVHEPRTEVENFRVVREGQVVGEARRTQHALVAEVELGSLGQFTFALVPASRDGRAERGFELGVKLGELVVGLVESVGKGDALF